MKKWILFITAIFYGIFSYPLFASTNHSRIAYHDVGVGAPLILIHAFPTDQQLWHPQQEVLQRYFRVITLDLWGFGQSSKVDGQAVTMSDYANEVMQLLNHLHIKKAIIGGESMGGYIALAFLQNYPERVAGLILSDTQAIADNPETKAKREIQAVEVLEHGTYNLINGFMSKALSPHPSEQLKTSLRHILENQPAEAMASALRGMGLRNDTSYLLANTQLPVLIITGEQDALISPLQSQRMQQLTQNSKLVVIKNAGHLSNLEQADRWNEAVITYFKENKTDKIKHPSVWTKIISKLDDDIDFKIKAKNLASEIIDCGYHCQLVKLKQIPQNLNGTLDLFFYYKYCGGTVSLKIPFQLKNGDLITAEDTYHLEIGGNYCDWRKIDVHVSKDKEKQYLIQLSQTLRELLPM